jgi:anti-sigma B factor antagonist
VSSAQNRLSHPLELRGPSLEVRLDVRDGTLHVGGTLDLHTVAAFHAAVSRLLDEARRRWVIDVEGLDSCDVTGLRALSTAYRRTLVRGRHVVVTGAPPWLCRALETIRLDAHLLEGRRRTG